MDIIWTAGIITLVVLVAMPPAGVPIAIALAVSSICAILPILKFEPAVLAGVQRIFSGILVLNPIAIPFFILVGDIVNKSEIAIRLTNFAKLFTERIPEALARTNVVTSILFGAISGSGTTAASTMSSIIEPVEEEEGYDRDFSAAVNVATAPAGLLIPLSNMITICALVSGRTSIAVLSMAGYIPGIMWGLSCMIVVYLITRKKGYESTRRFNGKEKLNIAFQTIPRLLMIVIVIDGIIGGIFTAAEGAVVVVVYNLVLSLFSYRSISQRGLPWVSKDSVEMTGIIIFLIGVSSIMSWMMAPTGLPGAILDAMLSISSNRYVILIIVNILLLIVGTSMDMTPARLIFTPISLPICQQIGMNSVHFGVMMILNLCIGIITSPVGTTLFMGVKVGKTKIENVIRPLLCYFAAIFFMLLLVTCIPALSMWLPGLLGYA